jgi:hypothetical protein
MKVATMEEAFKEQIADVITGLALETLAHPSAVPVRLDVAVERRLPRSVEWRLTTSLQKHSRIRPSTLTLPKSGCAPKPRVRTFICRLATTESGEPTWARGQD